MDTRENIINTAIESIKMRPDMVRIYPTLVIKDTKLANLYEAGIYKALSLNEAIEISSEIALLYRYSGINIIRIGLQPTENINEGKDVIAGPFHPAFRQLVEANIYKIYLENIIKDEKIRDDFSIFTSERNNSWE